MSVHGSGEVTLGGLQPPRPSGDGGVAPSLENAIGKVVLRNHGKRDRHSQNGLIFSRPKSEYISPAGISALDIRTRLRITEAELSIVQREVSDLVAERNALEASSRQLEESWRFSVSMCGQIVEERDELQNKYEMLEQAIMEVRLNTPELKGRKISKINKANLDQLRLSLETQSRVSEMLELERDRAFDDYEMAQAQLHVLFQQYQDLANSCSEVARDRDKYKADTRVLRDELQRCEPDSDENSSRGSLKKTDSSTGSGSGGSMSSMDTPGSHGADSEDSHISSDPNLLSQQLREAKDERSRMNSKYEQLFRKSEQFQKQLYRAEEDRRQALATSEALTSLWQKKFDKAQNENYDLRQELLSAHERISLLQDHLAVTRLQSRGPLSLSLLLSDNMHTSSDRTHNHTSVNPSPTVISEINHGRYSPVKGQSGSSVSGSIIGSRNGPMGGVWDAQICSLGPNLTSGETMQGSGGGASGSGTMPQRASSLHGFNKEHPLSHAASLTSSQKELVSPFSPGLHIPHMIHHQDSIGEEDRKRQCKDDGGRWI